MRGGAKAPPLPFFPRSRSISGMDTLIIMLIGSNIALLGYLCHKDMKPKPKRKKATA